MSILRPWSLSTPDIRYYLNLCKGYLPERHAIEKLAMGEESIVVMQVLLNARVARRLDNEMLAGPSGAEGAGWFGRSRRESSDADGEREA